MDRENPPPAIFPTDDNDHTLTDTDIMRSYAIDTLFDSEYYTGDTKEMETTRPPTALKSSPQYKKKYTASLRKLGR